LQKRESFKILIKDEKLKSLAELSSINQRPSLDHGINFASASNRDKGKGFDNYNCLSKQNSITLSFRERNSVIGNSKMPMISNITKINSYMKKRVRTNHFSP
jgi:hypothetical protein